MFTEFAARQRVCMFL